MALPTLDRHGCDRLPPDHSIEDHLEVERAALAAERQKVAELTAKDGRWVVIRAAGLGFAIAGVIAIGWNRTHPPEPKASCPAVTASASADAPDAADAC